MDAEHTTVPVIITELSKPFPIDDIHQLPVKSKMFDKGPKGLIANYIDARAVMERLDEVVGRPYWQREYQEVCGYVVCRIGIYVQTIEQWSWKSDIGHETDREPGKGAASDSFKRAAVNWGIGRFLHYIEAAWVSGYTDSRDRFYFDDNALETYRNRLANYLKSAA